MLSLVVPCFNEEDNVEKFYSQTVMAFESNIDEYEFVFVDDGSSDKTLERLHSLFDKDKSRVQVLSFSRNFGKEDNTVDCVTAYQAERKENKFMSALKSSFYKIINKMS